MDSTKLRLRLKHAHYEWSSLNRWHLVIGVAIAGRIFQWTSHYIRTRNPLLEIAVPFLTNINSTTTHPQIIPYRARRTNRIMVLECLQFRCNVICRYSNCTRLLCWFGVWGSMILSEPRRVMLLIREHRQAEYLLLYDLRSANDNGLSRPSELGFLLYKAKQYDTQTNNIASDNRVDLGLHCNKQLHLYSQEKISVSVLPHDLSQSRVLTLALCTSICQKHRPLPVKMQSVAIL